MHQQDHQSSNFERDIAEDLAVGVVDKDYPNTLLDYASSTGGGNKVKLPEIGYGVSHSTEVPDGFQKLNSNGAVVSSQGASGTNHNNNSNNMNNFNSDPYALRIK